MTPGAIPVDEGLLVRFRAAGAEIAWRDATGSRPKGARRIAHLHDEEATVVRSGPRSSPTFMVDSGPVGALVLLLEIDRRGLPRRLTAHESGDVKGFDQGALEASWGKGGPMATPRLPITDLVGLARYALV
ncbi:MAG: hypothetical protein ACREDK_00205 [Thermoplasmata archaeon]